MSSGEGPGGVGSFEAREELRDSLLERTAGKEKHCGLDVPFTSFLYCTFPFVPYAYVWFYPTVEEEVRFAVTTVPLVEMTVLLLAVLVAILVVVNTLVSRECVDGVEGVDAGQPKMDLAVSRGPTDFVTDISFAGVNYRDPADFANFNIFEAWR
ncbi:hypothetical protein T484DRAFT_1747985, partial [Baffinella frigidus]